MEALQYYCQENARLQMDLSTSQSSIIELKSKISALEKENKRLNDLQVLISDSYHYNRNEEHHDINYFHYLFELPMTKEEGDKFEQLISYYKIKEMERI